MRTAALVIALITVAASLWGAGGVGAAPAAVRIGAVVPLTGRYASLGAQVRAGYEFAVENTNAKGGVQIGGQHSQLALTLLDDESDATKTVSRLDTLAGQGVVAYLGTAGSDLHAAAAAIAEKNKIPYCGVAFALHTIHEHGYRYLFSPFPKSPDIAIQTYKFMNATLPATDRPKRIAIFQERTDWGREEGDLWTAYSKENGYQVVLRADYTPLSRDLSDIILRAKNAGADAVFAVPTPPDGITLIRQMKELDFNPKLAVMVRAPDGQGWSQALGKDGDYVMAMPGWHHNFPAPGVAELNAEHERKFGRPADVLVGPAYACVQIEANAIERAGKLDPAAIRDAMAATNMTTVVGPVRFRPDGTGIVSSVFVQWQAGKQEMVWPKGPGAVRFLYPALPWRAR
jgi:branched-chain amino acid transport system substrate-binding protein